MRIAIVGAGYAGLAVTWYLLHYTQGMAKIDLFDASPIGGGASGLSSGLLHAYAGKRASRNWHADRGLKETHRLLTEASRTLNRSLILSKGILRPALSEQQQIDFKQVASSYNDVEYWNKEQCEAKISGLILPENGGGLFIKDGLTVDVQGYLQGLWQACAVLGTQFRQQTIFKKTDLEGYDRILIAMGPASKNFPPLKELPITPIKGQILLLKWPEKVPPLPFSVISQKFLVMNPDQKTCLAGATFERHFNSSNPDPKVAAAEILPDIISYFPSLEGAEILGCKAAFRASSPNHLPLVGRVSEKLYFFTSLGSKGLLYHAWVGRRVARAMVTGSEEHFPSKLHCVLPK